MGTKKDKNIDLFYKIIALYEDMHNKSNKVDENSYLRYLNRLYVLYLGKENEEIYNLINGLIKLGAEANHDTVKSVAFHLISLVDKERG